MNCVGFLFVFVLFQVSAFSQDTVTHQRLISLKKNIFSVDVVAKYGFIFAHSEEVENTRGSYPYGAELVFSWQRNDRKSWDLCNCYPRRGLVLAYYDYDNRVLGSGAAAAYFLEPAYRLGKNVFFSFKGAAGLIFLTNPHHAEHNPGNQSYSTALSGFLLVGTGFWIRLHDKWWINPTINYQHASNGGMREPNKGINWPSAGLAISYRPAPVPYFSSERAKTKYWKGKPLRWDVGLFGMPRRVVTDSINSKRVLLLGLQAQVARQEGRISALTAGIELSLDRSLYLKLRKDSIDGSAFRAALLAGHEFLLGKFIFSQRLGVYLLDQTPYFDAIFHSWGIHFHASQHIGFGLNLKAHRHVAEYVDFRLVYSFD